MKNKYSVVSLIVVFVFLVLIMSSCSKPKLDGESLLGLKSYFDSIEEKDYKKAYSVLHPMLRDKIALDEFINNLKTVQDEDGDILAVKFDGIVRHVEGDYVYRVTIVREKKITKYDMEMLRDKDNKWYLNAVKGLSEKKREQ